MGLQSFRGLQGGQWLPQESQTAFSPHFQCCASAHPHMHTAHLSLPEDLFSGTLTHQQKPKNDIKIIYSASLEQGCGGSGLIVQMCFQF